MSYTLTEILPAVQDALANFTGEDTLDPAMVECVADRVLTALDVMDEAGEWTSEVDTLIESSSTFVQTDLDSLGLADYLGCFESALDEYCLV